MADENTLQTATPEPQIGHLDIQQIQSIGSIFSPALSAEMEKTKQTVTPVVQEVKAPETKIENAAVEAPVKTDTKPEITTPEFKNPFGIGKQKPAPAKEVKIENPEQLIEYINTKYGQDLKTLPDLTKFLEGPINTWRNDSQKLTAAQQKAADYEAFLASQPAAIIEAMKLNGEGHDFTEPFRKQKLDLTKTADKFDKFDLVNNYFPGKFSKEDFEGDDLTVATQTVYEAATEKFNAEKKAIADKRVEATNKAVQDLEAFKGSVSNSVQSLKSQFPDADLKTVTEIESILSGGQRGIYEQFFKPDGTLKPEAAEGLMWMKYGKETITEYMNAAARNAETKVNEEILTRGADQRKPVQKNGTTEQLSPELQKMLDNARALKTQKTF